MFDAKIGFNGDVNLNFNRNTSQENCNKEEIYEHLYKPLLLVNTCWLQHAEEVKPLLEKTTNCQTISKKPFYEIYNEIINYNTNYVKYLSLGKISSKYKQLSTKLIQCALYLEKHIDDEIFDSNLVKNTVHIHKTCDKLLDMLRYDFNFQL